MKMQKIIMVFDLVQPATGAGKNSFNSMNNEFAYMGNIMNIASEFIVNYGFQFIGAVIILVLGWQLARWFARATLNLCTKVSSEGSTPLSAAK